MIHPDTELRFVSKEVGYGVFATNLLPKGTILYARDKLDLVLTPKQYKALDLKHQDLAEKYSYIDKDGNRILSWDNAKYVNHRCDCNSMSTGYGFEIAIRDIEQDEEITDEYGLFNLEYPLDVNCGCDNCRRTLLPDDADIHLNEWDAIVQDALKYVLDVHQPLWDILSTDTIKTLTGYLVGNDPYVSIQELRYRPMEDARLVSAEHWKH